jgi:hypothetical protein
MGYGYTCEECSESFPDEDPALMAQIHEGWFKTTQLGGIVADRGYSPEQTLTLCGPCLLDLLGG